MHINITIQQILNNLRTTLHLIILKLIKNIIIYHIKLSILSQLQNPPSFFRIKELLQLLILLIEHFILISNIINIKLLRIITNNSRIILIECFSPLFPLNKLNAIKTISLKPNKMSKIRYFLFKSIFRNRLTQFDWRNKPI